MRGDRLLAMLLLLQARGGMSAPELARELEVSVRTVFRDLDALGTAGVPVHTERGSAGGIRLAEGYRTDLTGLSQGEAQSLFLLGIPGPLDDLGMGGSTSATERKLMAALPPAARRDAERARRLLHVDPAGWNRPPASVAHLATAFDAVWRERRLRLRYTRGDHRTVERTLDPLGLALKGSEWYLAARLGTAVVVYRVARIRAAEVLEEGFERPADWDTGAWWREWVARYEAGQHWVEVDVLVDAAFAPTLPWVLGEHVRPLIEAAPVEPDGRLALHLRFADLDEACISLLGTARHVEVVEPLQLRRALLTEARAIVERLADDVQLSFPEVIPHT